MPETDHCWSRQFPLFHIYRPSSGEVRRLPLTFYTANPISEYTLYSFFRNCRELRHVSIIGPVICTTARNPDDYTFVYEQGVSRLVSLELLDFDNELVNSGRIETTRTIPKPTTLDDILKTIPRASDVANASNDTELSKSYWSLSKAMLPDWSKASSPVTSNENLSKKYVRGEISSRQTDFSRFLRNNLSRELRILLLSGINTSDLLFNLAKRANYLTHCDLSNCADLQDRSVIMVAANCGANLRSLSLNGCSQVTDESIVEIGMYCSVLEYLDLGKTSFGERVSFSF